MVTAGYHVPLPGQAINEDYVLFVFANAVTLLRKSDEDIGYWPAKPVGVRSEQPP